MLFYYFWCGYWWSGFKGNCVTLMLLPIPLVSSGLNLLPQTIQLAYNHAIQIHSFHTTVYNCIHWTYFRWAFCTLFVLFSKFTFKPWRFLYTSIKLLSLFWIWASEHVCYWLTDLNNHQIQFLPFWFALITNVHCKQITSLLICWLSFQH